MKADKFVRIVGHSSGTTDKNAKADKMARYRARHGTGNSNHAIGTKGFIGVDGEGINLKNGEHRYVLFGVGNDQIEDENGIEWTAILDFLYAHYKSGFAFVGFYLSYDFDRWIRTMSYQRAYKLVTSEGRESRKSKSPNLHSRVLPVDMPNGYQINMLGKKMFEFRKRSCHCDILYCKCPGKGPWMRICDAGPFFQTSFLKAIDPRKWSNPIVTMAEYELIKKNKDFRAYADHITDEMRYYNRLENEILARLMNVLNSAFREMGIILAPGQWFGPGQAAQKWMKNECVPKGKEIREVVPIDFLFAAKDSYFGGWFEIMMHGIIPGETHEYDINSAYPHIISSLPCLLHGEYERGNGKPTKDTGYVLVYASVSSARKNRTNYIGTMLHREQDGTILRPERTRGWYWLHELNAAKNAKLISNVHYYQWVSYDPCDCLPPMRNVQFLYDLRIKVGKDTPLGKGARLAYNSMYGKLAQSIGDPIFSNSIYASLITSGCRTMILNAIATHPNGENDVCMVATDAVFFATPHPGLPISNKLGEWDYECRNNLTLFKPGVYWDDNTRADIDANRIPNFKARGVAAADFASCISAIDRAFQEWDSLAPAISIANNIDKDGRCPGWPFVVFESGFAMISCLQAIRRNKWELAGEVIQDQVLVQNACPNGKRWGARKDTLSDGREIWRSIPRPIDLDKLDSMPYQRRFGMEYPWSDESMENYGIHPDGTIGNIVLESIGLR